MVKIGKKLRIERELIAKEMQDAIMSADIDYLSRYYYITPRMSNILCRLHDWAERASNELG